MVPPDQQTQASIQFCAMHQSKHIYNISTKVLGSMEYFTGSIDGGGGARIRAMMPVIRGTPDEPMPRKSLVSVHLMVTFSTTFTQRLF